ncbi:MAG: sulfite exporter TauE/SafE family protein [Mycobacteriaceae bacterium]|nr:sulfite exporter TauE/SafE family protein [Mycobacterium sp. DSM 3803]MBX9641939.1 sulfite exporter TauE/SafE family protein [Mycobacteriaceae bacterium]
MTAGAGTCAAAHGGLLAGVMARQCPMSVASARLDLLPVGGFLIGKLASHCAVGALLGALGAAVALSVDARTAVQIGAGLVIITLGLAQLGLPGFRILAPPVACGRVVRHTVSAPVLVGVCTMFLPCGVTLSVEALAVASGSAARGALTMAVFVLGTVPLFAILGYATRTAGRVWGGRLAAVTGVVVIGMGLLTLNGGLELAGSSLSAGRVMQKLGLTAPAVAVADTVSVRDRRQQVTITATGRGYAPASIALRAGLPTTLVVHSERAEGCVRAFVVRDRLYNLPVDGDTPIDLGVIDAGTIRFACAMGMYHGEIDALTG